MLILELTQIITQNKILLMIKSHNNLFQNIIHLETPNKVKWEQKREHLKQTQTEPPPQTTTQLLSAKLIKKQQAIRNFIMFP